jgi:hypothetical protein
LRAFNKEKLETNTTQSHMKKTSILTLLFSTFLLISVAQNYPQGYFIAPLDPPLELTGTFGEVRDNHFHSGIDLSTDEEEGVPVMAAADGYVSRIKIAPDGYGKALYITHPNGYVSVYGHLQKFTAQINSYIRRIQYERQVFELDLNPKPEEFVIHQRDVIGYSGSTGSAQGPHVHFEIRDEKTEEPINPLLFGLPLNDTIPPEIHFVRIFPKREGGILEKTDSAMTYELVFENGSYRLGTETAPGVYGNVGFGFNATDYQDSNMTSLGIYGAELYVDGKLSFTTIYDRFNFNDTRYANAHIDYMLNKREGIEIERCFRLPGDRMKIYGELPQTGYTNFLDAGSHQVKIVVSDFSGNKSQVVFNVSTNESLRSKTYMQRPAGTIRVPYDKGVSIQKSKLEVSIPEGAFYEDFDFDEQVSKSAFLSDIYTIGNPDEPLQLPMTIGLKPNKDIPDSMKIKALIVRMSDEGDLEGVGNLWNDKILTAKTYEFGNFAIVLDTVPPMVEKYYVPADMNTMYGGVVQIRVKDNLSEIKNYSGKINDKWHLFEYDKKNNMLIANVESMDVNETHPIEVTVTDQNGNTTVWKSTFYY